MLSLIPRRACGSPKDARIVTGSYALGKQLYISLVKACNKNTYKIEKQKLSMINMSLPLKLQLLENSGTPTCTAFPYVCSDQTAQTARNISLLTPCLAYSGRLNSRYMNATHNLHWN